MDVGEGGGPPWCLGRGLRHAPPHRTSFCGHALGSEFGSQSTSSFFGHFAKGLTEVFKSKNKQSKSILYFYSLSLALSLSLSLYVSLSCALKYIYVCNALFYGCIRRKYNQCEDQHRLLSYIYRFQGLVVLVRTGGGHSPALRKPFTGYDNERK